MSDQSRVNNWVDLELVNVDDMKYANALMMQTLFGSMKPNKVLGVVPTISGATFSVTSGFAFFGTTSDPTYIGNTGVTTLFATIPAQGALTLVNPNCYIYVKPTITTELSNRYTLVTGTVYSSTNPADLGIKICNVVGGAVSDFTNNNINDYFFPQGGGGNALSLYSPDGVTPQGLYISAAAEVGGDFTVKGQDSFFLNGATGARVHITRGSNTAIGGMFNIIAEMPSADIPGQINATGIGLSGGTNNPVWVASFSGTQRWYCTANPGDVDPTVHIKANAMLGDLTYGIRSTPFSYEDINFRVAGVEIFPSLTSGFTFSGSRSAVIYPDGITTKIYSLITAGVISSTRPYSTKGVAASLVEPQWLSATCTFDGTNFILEVNNTKGADILAGIDFSMTI